MTITQYELHEELNALLWQYSVGHKGTPEHDTLGRPVRYVIVCFSDENSTYGPGYYAEAFRYTYPLVPYFDTEQIANDAIEKIVKPFMEKHPEFVW